MYKQECIVCGKETSNSITWQWSPQTWMEKGPLPLSAFGCSDHKVCDIIRSACDKYDKDRHPTGVS